MEFVTNNLNSPERDNKINVEYSWQPEYRIKVKKIELNKEITGILLFDESFSRAAFQVDGVSYALEYYDINGNRKYSFWNSGYAEQAEENDQSVITVFFEELKKMILDFI